MPGIRDGDSEPSVSHQERQDDMPESAATVRLLSSLRLSIIAIVLGAGVLIASSNVEPTASAMDFSRGELGGPESGLVVERHSCDEPVSHIRPGMGILIN